METPVVSEEAVKSTISDIIRHHFGCSRGKARRAAGNVFTAMLTFHDREELQESIKHTLLLNLAGTDSAESCAADIVKLNYTPVSAAPVADKTDKKNVTFDAFLKLSHKIDQVDRRVRTHRGLVEDIGDENSDEPANNKILRVQPKIYALLTTPHGQELSLEQKLAITKTRLTLENPREQNIVQWCKWYMLFYVTLLLAYPVAWAAGKMSTSIPFLTSMSEIVGTPVGYLNIIFFTIVLFFVVRRLLSTPASTLLFVKGPHDLRAYADTSLNGLKVIKFTAGDDVDIYLHSRNDINRMSSETLHADTLRVWNNINNHARRLEKVQHVSDEPAVGDWDVAGNDEVTERDIEELQTDGDVAREPSNTVDGAAEGTVEDGSLK